MEKVMSKKAKIVISVVTVIVFVALLIGGILLYIRLYRTLNFDYRLGGIAVGKVENAQYTPDIDKYLEANASPQGVKAVNNFSKSSSEEFTAIIDEYAKVRNYTGAGKYLGYDIYEIKNEIKFVIENVPAFNQWFRMPEMREKKGFASIPYYDNWAYYLEMDEETSMLSITRVCWATRSSYLDFANRKTVKFYSDGSSFIQFEVMKTNYLETEDDEIVECFIYSVGIDHWNGGYNKNTSDYYPFEFQYLRNVKDKQMVKYHITVSNRYRDDYSFDEGGMDIRGLTPYGVRREFMIVNYDGYQDIDITKIDQKFATLNEPENDGAVDFDVNSNNIRILLDTIGYEEDYSTLSPKELLDEVAKHIIDNFELKNNWQTIYKEQSNAIEVDGLYGPFYEKEMWVSDVNVYVSCCGNYGEEIEFDAHANIYDESKFDENTKYSLSMALRSRESGNLYIVATDYHKLEIIRYNGGKEYYSRLASSHIRLDSSKIAIDEDGTYDVVCVLTIRENGKDIVAFDTQEIGFMRGYYGLQIPDSIDANGVTHKYAAKGTGGKLTIVVSSDLSVE